MSRSARLACVAVVVLGGLTGPTARAGDAPVVDAKAAFARMKTLAGEWKSETSKEMPHSGRMIYQVTANGSVVMETMAPGTNHEMISMYHLDGDDLRMTHYCAAGNQPRFKLDRKASKPEDLKFVFDGGTNLDPAKDMHIHSARIMFGDKGRVVEEWEGSVGGKCEVPLRFTMSRP